MRSGQILKIILAYSKKIIVQVMFFLQQLVSKTKGQLCMKTLGPISLEAKDFIYFFYLFIYF